jgi:ABC-type multidrug transport system permease subunit
MSRKPKRVVIDEEVKVYPMFPEENRWRWWVFALYSLLLILGFAFLAIIMFTSWTSR